MSFAGSVLTAATAVAAAGGLAAVAAAPLARRWFPPLESERLRDHIAFDCVIDDSTIRCVDGTLLVTIAVRGTEVSTKGDDEQDELWLAVKTWVEEMAKTPATLRVYSMRSLHDRRPDVEGFDAPWLRRIQEAWSESFRASYDIEHTLVLSVPGGTDAAREGLAKAVHVTLQRLKPFSPEVLELGKAGQVSPLLSFWGRLLNPGATVAFRASSGVPTHKGEIVAPVDKRLADDLIRTRVLFADSPREDDGVIVFQRGAETVFGGMIGLTTWNTTTSTAIIDAVLTAETELVVCQLFRSFEVGETKVLLEALKRNNSMSRRAVEQLELVNLGMDMPEGGERVRLARHQLAVMVLGLDRRDLEHSVAAVVASLDRVRTGAVRMTAEAEPTWFQMFPPHGDMRGKAVEAFATNLARPMLPTTANVAHLTSFECPPRGHRQVPQAWGGGSPLTMMRTVSGAPYALTLHKEAVGSEKPLGNALVIGAPGAGKTTLVNFLAATMTGYPNAHLFLTDRHDGSYVLVEACDGAYIHLLTDHEAVGETAELAPMQLPYKVGPDGSLTGNGMFLLQWLRDFVTGVDDPQEVEALRHALVTNASLAPEHRNLHELHRALPDGPMKVELGRWVAGGTYPNLFNGRRNSLDFAQGTRLAAFDFTRALTDQRLVRALMPLLQYSIEEQMKAIGAPWGIVVDEAAAMITDPAFFKWYMQLHQEVRKSDGFVMSCFQRAGSVGDLGAQQREMLLTSCPCKIIFPNKEATQDEYVNVLGLTMSEFDFVRRRHPISANRKHVALVKKDGEGSIIVDLDLTPLSHSPHGNLLTLFESGREPANLLRSKIREFGRERGIEEFVRVRSGRPPSRADSLRPASA